MPIGVRVQYKSAEWKNPKIDLTGALFHSPSCFHLPPIRVCSLSFRDLKRLSCLEAAHFFRLNVAGEAFGIDCMRRASDSLLRELGISEYRDRLLAEEASHTKAFLFALHSLGENSKVEKSMLGQPKELASIENFLDFFSAIFIFEFVTTRVSEVIARDQNVDEGIRALHAYHVADERHHLRVTSHILRELSKIVASDIRKAAFDRTVAWSEILARAFFPAVALVEFSDECVKESFSFSFHSGPERNFFELARSSVKKALTR